MANGTSGNVELGPGWLYVAAVGTSEPTTASAALPSAWRAVGYTEDGSTFTDSVTTTGIEVAEEFYPIRIVTTGVSAKIEFKMAEMTLTNLALAVNQGANVSAATLEPPTPGAEVRVMVVWDYMATGDVGFAAGNKRLLCRQVFFGGDIAIDRKKSPAKSLYPVTGTLEKPTGLQPWIAFKDAAGLF